MGQISVLAILFQRLKASHSLIKIFVQCFSCSSPCSPTCNFRGFQFCLIGTSKKQNHCLSKAYIWIGGFFLWRTIFGLTQGQGSFKACFLYNVFLAFYLNQKIVYSSLYSTPMYQEIPLHCLHVVFAVHVYLAATTSIFSSISFHHFMVAKTNHTSL